MLHLSRTDSHFMAADCDYEKSKAAIAGFPMDLTVSGRHGTGAAPKRIREASYLLETYSPHLNMDLRELKLSDIGDMELPFSVPESLEIISRISETIIKGNKKIISLGGEHLISLPIISWEENISSVCLLSQKLKSDIKILRLYILMLILIWLIII